MLLPLLSTAPPDRSAIVTVDQQTSWAELRKFSESLITQLSSLRGRRVGVLLPASAAGLAALCALDELKAHAYLLDEGLPPETVDLWAERFALDAIIRADGAAKWHITRLRDASSPTVTDSTVTILTSGTEGLPKAASYTWQRLAQPVRRGQAADRDVWLLTFRIHLYAGLQVLLQALLNGQTLVAPAQGCSPDEVARLMVENRVSCASATPSYWRRLLLFADNQLFTQVPMRQITLGGELADQAVLDGLHATFPQARIVHIYATTELGRCFAVSDGLAGFPRSFLYDPARPAPAGVDAQLKVADDQLYVRPAHGMNRTDESTSNDAGWIETGDLVELTADRVLFAGRAGDMINVGGNKVRPAVVEQAIRAVPGVTDVRVYGQSSSIAGQLVACQIVPAVGQDPAAITTAVAQACRATLQPYQCPRLIQCVDEIQLTTAGKVSRQAE